MYDFIYGSPTTLAEAEELLGTKEGPTLLAAGHTPLPTRKLRLAEHDVHAAADYRKHQIGVMARRAVAAATS